MGKSEKIRATLTAICCNVMLSCATYSPAPQDSHAIFTQREALVLDEAAVRTELARLAPSVSWDGREWDSLTLLAAAFVSNPDLAVARASVAAAKSSAIAATKAPGPNLVLATEYALNSTDSSPWLFGIAADFALDIGVRRDSRIEIADLDLAIALFDLMDTAWAVRQRIRTALQELLFARQELAVANDLTALRRRQVMAMEHRVEAGAASSFELQRLRADLASDQQLLLDIGARAEAALTQLAAAIGVSRNSLKELDLYWPDIGAPIRLADPLPAPFRQEAILARSDIARASANYDRAESSLRSEVAAQFPTVHVTPGYIWERGLKKLPLAIGLAMPPLDLNRSAIAAAEARREEAGRQLEATVFAAMSAVDIAIDAYRGSWAQLDNSRQQTSIAELRARKADAALASGAIDRIDWSTTQSAMLVAKLAELAATANLRSAENSLEESLRRPTCGPELAAIHQSTMGETACEPALAVQF